MKKTIKILFATFVATALLVACGGGSSEQEYTGTKDADFKVVVVLDSGGVDDKAFNQSTWEGVREFLNDNDLKKETASYLSSASDGSNYVSNLENAAENAELVIAVGFLFEDALAEVAPKYPDTDFLFIDAQIDGIPNVHGTAFAEEEGSYYVGLIAGKRAAEDGTNKVGFIGGIEGPVISAFQAGYEQGVWEANPEATVAVEYAVSFSDTAIGASLATKLYNGSNIIFHAAGNVGNGVITEAKNNEDKWVIGVDRDQYLEGLTKDDTSVVLTSMIKRVDVATYDFLSEYLDKGEIQTDTFVFNTLNNGVGAELSADRNLTKEEIAYVNEYIEKVKSGEVKISRTPTILAGQEGKRP